MSAIHACEQALDRQPATLPMKLVAIDCLREAGALERAVELAGELEPDAASVAEVELARAELARDVGVRDRDEAALLEAIELAERAPRCALLVHGSAQLQLGRIHPALACLHEVRELSDEPRIVDECDAWLALAEHVRGHRREAAASLAELMQRGARGRVLDGVAERIGYHPAR